MFPKLKILSASLLPNYLIQIPKDLQVGFDALQDAEISTDSFSFYTAVSSVFSSKIEGESIELDSYIKHKKFGIEFQPDYAKKIDDLYSAYIFAKTAILNQENVSGAHKLLSKHLLAAHQQGKFRSQNMYVTTTDGKIEYVAVTPYEVAGEMEKFYKDIEMLLNEVLSIVEYQLDGISRNNLANRVGSPNAIYNFYIRGVSYSDTCIMKIKMTINASRFALHSGKKLRAVKLGVLGFIGGFALFLLDAMRIRLKNK